MNEIPDVLGSHFGVHWVDFEPFFEDFFDFWVQLPILSYQISFLNWRGLSFENSYVLTVFESYVGYRFTVFFGFNFLIFTIYD